MRARLGPVQAGSKQRIDGLACYVENLPERGVRSAVVPVIDVCVREQDREANLVEVIAPAPRHDEEALEDGKGVVVTALHHVAAAESVCCGRGIARGER